MIRTKNYMRDSKFHINVDKELLLHHLRIRLISKQKQFRQVIFGENKLDACIDKRPILSACLKTLKSSPESFLSWERFTNQILIIETMSDLNNILQNELASDKPLKTVLDQVLWFISIKFMLP